MSCNTLAIPIRKLINASPETIYKLSGPVRIEFDDGIVDTLARRIHLSWYHWEFHRRFPALPALKRHLISLDTFKTTSHIKLANSLLRDIVVYCGTKEANSEFVSQIKFYLENKRYNDYVVMLERYAGTSSILDYIAISEDSRITEKVKLITSDEETVFDAYRGLKLVFEDPNFSRNNIVAAANVGVGKIDSLEQTLVCRGHITDTDNTIFTEPCRGSFTTGLTDFYELVIESRSAAKSLLFQKRPMEQAEWFHRQLQLMTNIIDELEGIFHHDNGFMVGHEHDCGSTDYITLSVKSMKDLSNYSGSYYRYAGEKVREIKGGLVEPYSIDDSIATSGEWAIVTEDRTDLIGTVIEVRNPLTCRSKKRNGVCSTCYGAFSYSLPKHTNIGFLAAAIMCDPLTQQLLSAKHYDKSSRTEAIELNEIERQYFMIGTTNRSLRLNTTIRENDLKLIIPVKDAMNLPDIMASSRGSLDNSYIGELQSIKLERTLPGGKRDSKTLDVSLYGTKSTFSSDFLRYMSKVGRVISKNNKYIIDLSDWDFNLDVFMLPKKHISMLDFLGSVKHFIYSAKSSVKEARLCTHTSVHTAIVEFYELVSSKVDVNIIHLSMIIKACMTVDPDKGDYNVPLYGEDFKFETFGKIMANRSAVSQLAHQHLVPLLLDPKSYLNKDKMVGILDPLFYNGEFSDVQAGKVGGTR